MAEHVYVFLLSCLMTSSLSEVHVRCTCPAWDVIQNDRLCEENTLLSLSFGNTGPVSCGQDLDAASLPPDPPRVTYPDADKNMDYLLIMVDPDAPYPDKPSCRYYLHWMVDNIKGTDLVAGSLDSARTITEYMAPNPPKTSSFHRYQLLVLRSPGSDITPVDDRCGFDLQSFLTNYKLCDSPLAVFQFKSGFKKT